MSPEYPAQEPRETDPYKIRNMAFEDISFAAMQAELLSEVLLLRDEMDRRLRFNRTLMTNRIYLTTREIVEEKVALLTA